MLGYAFSVLWEFIHFCRGGEHPAENAQKNGTKQEIKCPQTRYPDPKPATLHETGLTPAKDAGNDNCYDFGFRGMTE
jgi:hypothetical protein